MRKLFLTIKAIAFVGLSLVSTTALAGRGFIYETVGTVSVANGNDTPRPAAKNTPVTSGTVIRTGDKSHTVLKFEDGQVISLQPNSTFKVREYNFDPNHAENNRIWFSLYKGGLHSVTGLICKSNIYAFRLATPNATVRIQGAEFVVVLAKEGTYSKALSDWISVTNAAGESILTAGSFALISSSTTPPISIAPVNVPADTFSQIAAITVPPATPQPAPLETGALPDSMAVAGSTTAAAKKSTSDSVDQTSAAAKKSTSDSADQTSAAAKKSTMDTVGKASGSKKARKKTSQTTVASHYDKGSTSKPAAHGFYAGIQLGYASYRYSNISNTGQIGSGLLGGYTINEKYSIEATYNSLGGFESAQSTVKGSSFGLSGAAFYPINQQFNIFGKLGIAKTRLKESAKPGFTGSHQHNNNNITVGFGCQYNIGSTVGIRAGLDIHAVGDAASGKSAAMLVYTGGIFRF